MPIPHKLSPMKIATSGKHQIKTFPDSGRYALKIGCVNWGAGSCIIGYKILDEHGVPVNDDIVPFEGAGVSHIGVNISMSIDLGEYEELWIDISLPNGAPAYTSLARI